MLQFILQDRIAHGVLNRGLELVGGGALGRDLLWTGF